MDQTAIYLDVAVSIFEAVDLIEVETTNFAHRSVHPYSPFPVPLASLIPAVLNDSFATLDVGD
jgi:hypothetical protein